MSRFVLWNLSVASLLVMASRSAFAEEEGDGNGIDNLDDATDPAADETPQDDPLPDAGAVDASAPTELEEAEDGGPPRDGPPWKLGRPGLEPAVGAVLFGGGGLLALGAEGSVPFAQETQDAFRWGGRARVVGQVLVGPDLFNGYAARLGVFAGPSAGPARLRVGPDFFLNQFVFGTLDADPFSGIGMPLTLSLGGDAVGIYGGVEPAWYVSGGWPGVDWSNEDLFGFGDEFTYKVGAHVSTKSLGLGLGYTHRITSFGLQQGISVGLGF